MTSASPEPKAPHLDLPELDQSSDGDEVDVGAFELSMGEGLDPEELYGTTDGFELGISEQTEAPGEEGTGELDIGSAELLNPPLEQHSALDSEEAEAPLLGLGLNLEPPSEQDEGAAPEFREEQLEELPELAREDADGAAGPDREGALLPFAPEGDIAQGPSCEVTWISRAEPYSAVWAKGGEVLAAASSLMRYGRAPGAQPLPSGARASSLTLLDSGLVLLATTRGLLQMAPTGAATFIDAPEFPRGSGNDVVEVAFASGEHPFWARLSGGALFRRRGQTWERHETGGQVRSLSCVALSVALLVVSSRPTLQISADGGNSFRELLLPATAASVALGDAPLCLAVGTLIAIADTERGLAISSDNGGTFTMVTGAVNLSAIAVGEYRGAACLFAALHREAVDTSEILLIGAGPTCRIASFAGQPAEDSDETGRTIALAWDGQALWAAGGYGLVRLAPAS